MKHYAEGRLILDMAFLKKNGIELNYQYFSTRFHFHFKPLKLPILKPSTEKRPSYSFNTEQTGTHLLNPLKFSLTKN